METRRRSARLQLQTPNIQNTEAGENQSQKKKTVTRGSKKNEPSETDPPPMKPKTVPKPKKPAPKGRKSAAKPASEDPELEIHEPEHAAPKTRSAPKRAAKSAKNAPKCSNSLSEESESDDGMEIDEPPKPAGNGLKKARKLSESSSEDEIEPKNAPKLAENGAKTVKIAPEELKNAPKSPDVTPEDPDSDDDKMEVDDESLENDDEFNLEEITKRINIVHQLALNAQKSGKPVEIAQKSSKSAPKSSNPLSEDSESDDDKMEPKPSKSAQKSQKPLENAPKLAENGAKIVKNAPKRSEPTPEDPDSDDQMEIDEPPKAAQKSRSSAKTGPNQPKNAPKSMKNAPKSSDATSEDPDSDDMEIAAPAPKSSENAPKPAQTRPRRSITTAKKVSYVAKDHLDDLMELSSSSSSDDASDSDDQMELSIVKEKPKSMKRGPAKGAELNSKIPKKRSKAYRISSESESSESYESDDASEASDDAPGPSEPRKSQKSRNFGQKTSKNRSKPAKDAGDVNWPKCSKASIARKTGNPKNSKNVKSGLRMATKPKPPQPWKKNLEGYEADRKMAKGERRMKEYRHVAHAYARGKIEEVSYDECFKIHENMKKAYLEGRKIIEAIEKEEEKQEKIRKSQEGEESDGGNSSEDEWEEMEHFHPILDDNIEVNFNHEQNGDDDEEGEDVEKDWWVVYLRQEINKKIRESWENTHKVHLLCFMAHLKLVVKTSLDESLVPSLMMSQLPNGYLKYVGEIIPIDVMKNMIKWFADAFRPLNGVVSVAAIEQDLLDGHEARYPETSRLTALVDAKCFETDLDRATLLFCLLRGLEATARICVNARTIPRKWDKNQQKELQDEMDKFREISRSRSTTPPEGSEKKEESEGTSSSKKGSKKNGSTQKKMKKEERNYWVEYWQPFEKRWICIDPLHKTVDEPLTIHQDAATPISYVFAIDNRQGICEVSQRYAMDCVKQEFRRRRTDPKWVSWTLSLRPFAANSERKKWESMQMREDLVKRPLPTVMSEFKNHPLYVLEKDLLKFEAIYPPPQSQKPLGQIRGHNVYPRSCVFTLQGENNWLKLARSVKIGEKPYKVVKARPDPRIPVEDRVEQFLNVFGYWQTEPYRRPPLKNGKIPHNDYGNVYMFNECMCPLECVHLKLPGLVQISRKLNKQCVPAVVGWAFDGGWTHPVIDGAIVLQKDADEFIREWERLESGRAEREEKNRVDKIHENWKKLIKGMLRLAYVRKQFGTTHPPKIQKKKSKNGTKTQEKGGESMDDDDGGAGPSEEPIHHIIDNSEQMNPIEGFSLDDFINKKK